MIEIVHADAAITFLVLQTPHFVARPKLLRTVDPIKIYSFSDVHVRYSPIYILLFQTISIDPREVFTLFLESNIAYALIWAKQ